jgi:hypothetical protein
MPGLTPYLAEAWGICRGPSSRRRKNDEVPDTFSRWCERRARLHVGGRRRTGPHLGGRNTCAQLIGAEFFVERQGRGR